MPIPAMVLPSCRAAGSAAEARQIRSFDRPELTALLTKVWGDLRDTPKDKSDLIAKLKSELTPTQLASV